MKAHEYIDGRCRHCGDKEADNIGRDRLCVDAPMPRAIPTSVFDDIDGLHARIQELRREHDASIASTTLIE